MFSALSLSFSVLPPAPQQRPKLNLKPRSVPKEEEANSGGGGGGTSPAAAPSPSTRASSIFGAAKPVDTAAKEREVEERLKKEEERLQRQLEEDKNRGPDRKIRDRSGVVNGRLCVNKVKYDCKCTTWNYVIKILFLVFRDPSWRNEEPHTERSRTGSESSQPGSTSGRGGTSSLSYKHTTVCIYICWLFFPHETLRQHRPSLLLTISTGSRCRDSERSGENEVFSGRESDPSSPGSSSRPPSTTSSKEPLKVMPAPPPKENAWAKRSAASTGSNEGDGRPAVSPVSPSGSVPPKLR